MEFDKKIKEKYPKTTKAILEAFLGESGARNKYEFFAKVARKESHQKLADFFEETAKNEFEHAKLLYKLIGGIGDTNKNLKTCIEDEIQENTTMYPNFAKIADKEGFKDAKELFEKLAKIEKEHEKRFKRLLKQLENNTLYQSHTKEKIVWICQKCGNVEYASQPPKICPVCEHPKGYYEKGQTQY